MWCYGIWGCGVRPADTAYIAFGYGSFIGFWGLHYAMEKIGVLNVPGWRADAPRRGCSRSSTSARPSSPSTPTYALRLAQEAARPRRRPAGVRGQPADPVRRARGLDPADQGADRGAVGSQGVRHRRDDRDRHDHGVRVLAPARRHAHHRGPHDRGGARSRRRWSRFRYGERGERVVTSFGRGAIPLLRYRTGDLVCKVPAVDVRVRARVRHLRGRDPRPRRRHEARPRNQRVPARDRGDRARVPRGRRVPDRDHARGDPRRDHAARRAEAGLVGGPWERCRRRRSTGGSRTPTRG